MTECLVLNFNELVGGGHEGGLGMLGHTPSSHAIIPTSSIRPVGSFGSWDDAERLRHVIPDSQRHTVDQVVGALFSDVLKLEDGAKDGRVN